MSVYNPEIRKEYFPARTIPALHRQQPQFVPFTPYRYGYSTALQRIYPTAAHTLRGFCLYLQEGPPTAGTTLPVQKRPAARRDAGTARIALARRNRHSGQAARPDTDCPPPKRRSNSSYSPRFSNKIGRR